MPLPVTAAEIPIDSPPGAGDRLAGVWWFWLIVAAFFAVRLPVMYHQPGGEDEDCYAVPGLTILRTGLPQLPHVPARNPESVYYGAERILYAEPPLTFYLQAALYAFLPHVYGTARLLSALAGVGVLAFVWRLTEKVTASSGAAAVATGLLSVSRWFYFPAFRARPDILTAFFGMLAIWMTLRWLETRRTRDLVKTGMAIGLGGLTHPFALVYAVQIAVWLACTSRGWRRLTNPAVVAVVSMAVTLVWLPLILMEPEIFRIQFHNQFLAGESMPLPMRLIISGPSLAYHLPHIFVAMQPWQCCLALGALLICTLTAWRQPGSFLWTTCLLAWSSMYLISCLVGPHHPVLGYWAYPAALMFVGVGAVAHRIGQRLSSLGTAGKVLKPLLIAVLVASLVPGMGLRTTIVHLKHWNDINYNEPAMAKKMLSEFPADKVYIVDTQFLLDFVAAGRKTLLAQTMPMFFRADLFDYDYLIISRYGVSQETARKLCGVTEYTMGIEEDPFACYAEIDRPTTEPCEKEFTPPGSELPVR